MATLRFCSTQFYSECKTPCIVVAGLKYILLSANGILDTMAKWDTEEQNRSFSDYSLQLLRFVETVSKASSPFRAVARNWGGWMCAK